VPGGRTNRVRVSEELKPRLQILAELLWTEARYARDGITNTRNSHHWLQDIHTRRHNAIFNSDLQSRGVDC
jgi:hypothetical protein